MEQKTKIQARFEYTGCGFPVTILNAPLRMVAGHWVLDLDTAVIDSHVVLLLAKQAQRLTGKQVQFFRKQAGWPLRELAARLGVSFVAVHKWEELKGKPTGMDINNERVLRAIMFLQLGHSADEALRIITELNAKSKSKSEAMRMDADELKESA